MQNPQPRPHGGHAASARVCHSMHCTPHGQACALLGGTTCRYTHEDQDQPKSTKKIHHTAAHRLSSSPPRASSPAHAPCYRFIPRAERCLKSGSETCNTLLLSPLCATTSNTSEIDQGLVVREGGRCARGGGAERWQKCCTPRALRAKAYGTRQANKAVYGQGVAQ